MPLKICSRRIKEKKNANARQKTNASQLSSKNVVRNFTAFDLIDSDVYKIVPAVLAYFFKDLNVLPAVLFTIAYRLPELSGTVADLENFGGGG